MKKIITLLSVIIFFGSAKAQEKNADGNKFRFKSLYNYAIQEDVKSMLSILDTLPESRLEDADKSAKEKLFQRFRTKNERFEYNTDDPVVINVFDIYKDYWNLILLKEKTINEADTILYHALSDYLIVRFSHANKWNAEEIKTDPTKYLTLVLTNRKFFSNVEGKTGNLFDIFIWRTRDIVDYKIKLPDGNITVPVVFMKDFVSLGWEEYATLGVAYPGGWPRDSMLYCVAKGYDIKDEKFLVSYLGHESQHFSDIKNYKEISAWRMEYRSKLAELSQAKTSAKNLLISFSEGAKNDSTLTHPFAEYCVIQHLSQKFFKNNFVTDKNKWNSIAVAEINKQATLLLKEDTKTMIHKQ